MKTKTQSPLVTFLRRNGAALLLCGGLFALTCVLVDRLRLGNNDYLLHLVWALDMDASDMLRSLYSGNERLWHILVNLTFRFLFHNAWTAVAVVTAAANAAAYFLIFKALDRALEQESIPRWLLAVLTAATFVVTAVYLPGTSFYSGPGTVNPWHNPTVVMVRPFAAAVFLMTVNIYNRRRCDRHALFVAPEENGRAFAFSGGFWAQFRQPVFTKSELVLYPLCLLLSTYAKPCFLQFFAPAIFLFLLYDVIRTRGRLLPFSIKLALAYVPVAFIILQQFFTFFHGNVSFSPSQSSGSGGIVVYYLQASFSGPGQVLYATGKTLLRALRLTAFPLFVIAASPKGSRGADQRLSVIGFAVAKLEHMFLHETGARAAHGNFSWGLYTAAQILWLSAIGAYVRLLRDKSRKGRALACLASALLLWHLGSGIVYIARIMTAAKIDFYF